MRSRSASADRPLNTTQCTAPMRALAQKVMNHWGMFVAQMATWSPFFTPMAMRARAN